VSVGLALLSLLLWGTLVGLDLVSVPQMMIARPIVAGPVAGALLGDLPTGLALGAVFELFQYDILPVGAARYPEYGPATVAAVSAAHGAGGVAGIGLGACVGLVTAYLGGAGIEVVRRLNSRAAHAVAARLEAGDTRVLVRLHLTGIGRDALRAALVTGSGLGLAALVGGVLAGVLSLRGVALLDAAAVGAALAAAAAGTLRLVGRGPNLRWFAAGVAGGVALAWLR
jgi:mannose/fructose/N-acetylgalactosamine-specific phosphotransferase system component IIC